MTQSPNTPPRRPTPDQAGGPPQSWPERLRANAGSIRQLLLIAGAGAVLFGGILYIFMRDLVGASYLVMGIGGFLLLVDAAISWRQVGRAIFGRRGRYGVNTVAILAAFIGIAIVINFFLFWLVNRPDPQGWLRVDTTATKQFILADQAITVLENLEEPVDVKVFMVTHTPEGAAAWRNTEDLLSEFRRRSTKHPFTYREIDPELEPNVAVQYGVTQYPAIVVEGLDSRRTEVIVGRQPGTGPEIFDEQQLITALLVVNHIKQKRVLFISGHSERDSMAIDPSQNPEGYGLAVQALFRDNYALGSATLTELGSLLMAGDPELVPAAIVFAGPEQDLNITETGILLAYLTGGGSAMFLLEPDSPITFLQLLAQYGLALGRGTLVDTSSFVAPNPLFLQVKNTNLQIPPHDITSGFDVLYFPGAAYVGVSIRPDTVPLTPDGRPYVTPESLATTTLYSWSETDAETIEFDPDTEVGGVLPIAIAVEAIADLTGTPRTDDTGQYITANLVVVGDADFASNGFFASAKNGDLFVNSINWLVRDYELISIRPKVKATRELVLTRSERDFVRWTGWLLMPALAGAAGIWTAWRRR